MAATGGITGRTYTEADILGHLYPRMKDEPLLNDQDELVIPVRMKDHPHFRRIGKASFGTRIGISENNPTHNECVRYLHEELANPMNTRVSISSYIFAEDRSREEQVIFSTLPTSEYCWFLESEARVAFDDQTYIQPDLAGRDVRRFFPRASCPNIIIEVVRTHAPDENTFRRLYELSLANTMIVFYFIAEGYRAGKLNNVRREQGLLTLRVSHYMLNGLPYKNGKATKVRQEDERTNDWYRYLSNSYFTAAKESA